MLVLMFCEPKFFTLKNLGPVSWALQTSIVRDREDGIIKISHEQYALKYLNRGGFFENKDCGGMTSGRENHAKTTTIFFPSGREKILDDSYDRVDENLKKSFQMDIGALWWLA